VKTSRILVIDLLRVDEKTNQEEVKTDDENRNKESHNHKHNTLVVVVAKAL
jgi:hypothetical protein